MWNEFWDWATQKTLNTTDTGSPTNHSIEKPFTHKHILHPLCPLASTTQKQTMCRVSMNSSFFQNLFCLLPLFGSIDITPDGMKAIVTLSTGDMRRSLNILQVRIKKFAKNYMNIFWTVVVRVLQKHAFSWCSYSNDVTLSCVEYSYGLWEGDGGHSVHVYRTSTEIRHRQHTGLGS